MSNYKPLIENASDVDTQNWQSHHVHVGVDLLGQDVNSLISEYGEKLKDKPHFFIRYADKGPHLRIRVPNDIPFPTVSAGAMKAVTPDLENEAWISQLRGNLADLPSINNSGTIEEVPYEREIDRYGGPHAIHLAEDNFVASTRYVEQLFKKHSPVSVEELLAPALRLYRSYYTAFLGEPDAKATEGEVSFFERACLAYLDAECGHGSQSFAGITRAQAQGLLNETHISVKAYQKGFDNAYSSLGDSLRDLIGTIRYFPLDRNVSDSEATFHESIRRTAYQYRDLAKKGQLGEGFSNQAKLVAVAASLFHMNANRMGLHIMDEAWCCYLLSTKLED